MDTSILSARRTSRGTGQSALYILQQDKQTGRATADSPQLKEVGYLESGANPADKPHRAASDGKAESDIDASETRKRILFPFSF